MAFYKTIMISCILINALLPALLVSASTNSNGQKSVVQQKVAVADIALAIDQSASIRDHYRQELDFAKKFVNSFPVGANETRFALVQFSFANMTRVRLPWSEGTDRAKILSTLDSMEKDALGAGTDFARALQVAYEQVCTASAGDRPEVPNVLVMVTDGFFNNPWERKQSTDIAAKLRDSGVLLYAIQVKTDPSLPVGQGPVDDLTLLTGNRSRVFAVENFEKLTNELLGRITQQISVEYGDCVYEYVPVGACYTSSAGKCVSDGELKIERPAQAQGQQCPTVNRTQIDCQHSDGCRGTGNEQNTINPLPFNAEKDTAPVETAGSKLPFWAIVVLAAVGGLILLLMVLAIIVARTPRWRAIFTPSKPRKPQLPGNMDDSHSSSASSGV